MPHKNTNDIENSMIALYNSLSEKDRRRYAGVEAKKTGHGGVAYIAALFMCDEKTISKGMAELEDKNKMKSLSVRLPGGGRRSKLDTTKNIHDVFLMVLRDYTAGDPMKKNVKWTNLTKSEIRNKMAKKGIKISKNIIKKLFKRHGFSKKKAQKSKSTGEHKDRNKQFNYIAKAKKIYEASDNPIISVDTKKKENIGNLYRDGKLECVKAQQVYDHDYPSLAEGKISPYGVYDIKNNEAFINIGTSHDTSKFACDSIGIWWNTIGKKRYPNAKSILILSDSGGSNSYRTHVYKEELQLLSNKLGIELRISHYPPYTSKWNPIEHRVFCHVTSALSGVILTSVELANEIIKTTSTQTGLKVFTRISKKIYVIGKKVASDFYETAKIVRDKILGQWNYVITPT